MSKKHLRLTPHNVTKDFWWYEENGGITVIMRHRRLDGICVVTEGKIPWRAIRNALARKDK